MPKRHGTHLKFRSQVSFGNQTFCKFEVQKGHNSGKNCPKIVIIEFDLDIHTTYLHAISSFISTFSTQVIIRRTICLETGSKKKTSGKNCQKSSYKI